MATFLNPTWMNEIRGKVNAAEHHGQPFEVILSASNTKKFVVLKLVEQKEFHTKFTTPEQGFQLSLQKRMSVLAANKCGKQPHTESGVPKI